MAVGVEVNVTLESLDLILISTLVLCPRQSTGHLSFIHARTPSVCVKSFYFVQTSNSLELCDWTHYLYPDSSLTFPNNRVPHSIPRCNAVMFPSSCALLREAASAASAFGPCPIHFGERCDCLPHVDPRSPRWDHLGTIAHSTIHSLIAIAT